ncbi:MAG: hypothetical protein C5B50_01635 [Verrucomicrobia bacterium]|nr:MAG: hypothetical protein C5B50_01635 [Verrucomicrobiota bacterium]
MPTGSRSQAGSSTIKPFIDPLPYRFGLALRRCADYWFLMTAIEEKKRTSRSPAPYPLSVEAYHVLGELGYLPEKTELVNGLVYAKMPESPLHALLFMRLLGLLQKCVASGTHVRPEKQIRCRSSEPVSDLAVVRGSIEDYAAGHPRSAELIIEVCVTSHDYDRSKLRDYAEAAVKEVWLVLAPEKQIEVHRHSSGDQFRERVLRGPGGHLVSEALPQFTVELDSLFKEV